MGSSPTHAMVQVGTFCHSWYQYRKFATTKAHYLRNTLATIRGALLKVSLSPSPFLLLAVTGTFGPDPDY